MTKSESEVAKAAALESHEFADRLRVLRARFREFRGRL